MSTERMRFEIWGPLLEALKRAHKEVGENPNVFEVMTVNECGRRLLAHALREHFAGRGPWPDQ